MDKRGEGKVGAGEHRFNNGLCIYCHKSEVSTPKCEGVPVIANDSVGLPKNPKWLYLRDVHKANTSQIRTATGGEIAFNVYTPHADLIVRAVNSFGELVEALKDAYRILDFYKDTVRGIDEGQGLGFRTKMWNDYMTKIELALKNAKGEGK